MDLHDYVRILRKNWILILIVVVGVAGGAGYAALQHPKYNASTQLYVSVRTEGAATGDLVQGQTFARQMVTSYADIVGTALILAPVIQKLNLDTTSAQLAKQVTATTPLNTVLIDISVVDGDADRAAKIANAVAVSFTDAIQSTLEKPTGGNNSLVQVTVTEPAAAPAAPSSPNIPLTLALGAVLGLALGLGIAVLRTMLDTRVHTLHDLEAITSKPVLGGIAKDPDAAKRPLIVHADPRGPRAESFRALRTNLQFLAVDDGPRVFVVSSAGPGEGKSTTAANLAIALAETGARVALIDGDLRLPRVADYMGIEGGVGLTDVLIGRIDVADALQKWGGSNLFVLTSGRIPPNPSELLGSTAMDQVLAPLGDYFDYVLIDAPPLLLVTDAAVLGKKARGVILVSASGETRKQELTGAIRTLETAGVDLLGVVATKLPTKGPDSYGYGSYTYGMTHSTTGEITTVQTTGNGKSQKRRKRATA
ncbi:polysaccharide biosynthesis tyrosine autokinase [Microbacterium sp. ASV81]|uniref:Polysaccharide biosynthesis tyrosine autokinase n=1 Tax=Microbacterium capsulatum TaxID=3041921 RepID=A0ABU0XGM8_9MICO|nr:polysaccharide biosynthesis tyrosine autokinase [Microbacterium sp. ASV81]MDQ4214285.1 polysaccharide biosynthesis tyrosine autokinase [Microbacterium sp. ASV81]